MTIKRIAGVLALVSGSLLQTSAQNFEIVGSWRTQIDIPKRPAGPIYGVMKVTFDGTMQYSDTTQIIPNRVGPEISAFAFTTPSIGVWQKVQNGYALSHVELLASGDSSLFGVCTTDFNVQLNNNGTEFTGTATYTCVDAAGGSGGPPQMVALSGKRITIPAGGQSR
jgi:hypothetical protein